MSNATAQSAAVPGLLGRIVRWNEEPLEPKPVMRSGRVYRVATSYGVEIAYIEGVRGVHGPCAEPHAVVQVARLEVA